MTQFTVVERHDAERLFRLFHLVIETLRLKLDTRNRMYRRILKRQSIVHSDNRPFARSSDYSDLS